MTAEVRIPVSGDPEAGFALEVEQVDSRLYLYEAGLAVFDTGKDQPLPARFPLRRDTPYVVLYENNDGGPGVFAFSIYETPDWQAPDAPRKLRRRLGPRHFDRPAVWDYRFRLVADPGLRPVTTG